MSEETFLQRLRSKPKHVRERMVFGAVILATPVLFYVWSATNHLVDVESASTVDTVRDTISGTFNNSIYEQTFGSTSFGKTQTATPAPTTEDTMLETQSDTSPVPTDTLNTTTTPESASGM